MPGLVPGIHVFTFATEAKTWMAGPSPRRRGFGPAGGTSPAMTTWKVGANKDVQGGLDEAAWLFPLQRVLPGPHRPEIPLFSEELTLARLSVYCQS